MERFGSSAFPVGLRAIQILVSDFFVGEGHNYWMNIIIVKRDVDGWHSSLLQGWAGALRPGPNSFSRCYFFFAVFLTGALAAFFGAAFSFTRFAVATTSSFLKFDGW